MHCNKKRKLLNKVKNICTEQSPVDDINECLNQTDKLLYNLPLHFKADSTNLMANDEIFKEPLRCMKRYRSGQPCNYLCVMENLEVFPKVDLWQILSQTLPQTSPGNRRFFKLIVSLPAGPVGDNMEFQLNRHLLKCPKDQSPDQSFYMRAFSQGIALSVVKIRGLDKWPSHLSHANGLVFFAHDQDLMEAKERLHLLAKTSLCPCLSLIIERFNSTQLYLQHLIEVLQLQELNLKGLKVYKCREDGLISSLKMGIEFLANESLKNREELQQVNLSEFLSNHLSSQLFQRIRQNPHLFKLCQKFPQLCQQVYNEAVHRLQLLAEEDLSMMPQLPQELSEYVEPIDNLNTNNLEHFQHNWHSKESRQVIVQFMEKIKMPTVGSMLGPQQWLTDYIKQTQPEECVDSIITRSTQRLLYGDGYLDLMELWVIERLPYILNHELPQPLSLVYKKSSLRTHFEKSWFYEFVQKSQFKVDMDILLMPPPPDRLPKEKQKPSVDPQEYKKAINRAQKVLNRYHLRREMTDLSKFLSLVKPRKRLCPTEENEFLCPVKRMRRN
uniref:GK19407 n=2 Tax=Drosophila willistoni TaxID=7260 RepID=B4MQE2_DROWI